jgi:uncharacterized cupin superfamily protein
LQYCYTTNDGIVVVSNRDRGREHERARFDWHYDETEECYFLAGHVIVETEDGQKVEVKKGDFAVFPKGLSCVWDIKEPIRKHYNLKGD